MDKETENQKSFMAELVGNIRFQYLILRAKSLSLKPNI